MSNLKINMRNGHKSKLTISPVLFIISMGTFSYN